MKSIAKWPFGLTLSDYDKAENTENKFKPGFVEIDWGRQKGQGKRNGHMIKGAMSNAPQGIKRYVRILQNVIVVDKDKKDLKCLDNDYKRTRYAKALSAGLRHKAAMVFSLIDTKEKFIEKLKGVTYERN